MKVQRHELAEQDWLEITYNTSIDKDGNEIVDWYNVKIIHTHGTKQVGVLTGNAAAFLKFFIDNENADIGEYDWPIVITHRERIYKRIQEFLGEYAWHVRFGRRIGARYSRIPDKTDSPILASANECSYQTTDLETIPVRIRQSDNMHTSGENYFMSELRKAEEGDIESMLQVGTFYFYGITVDRDFKKAAYWLKKVSESESEYSYIADKYIARMYYSGVMPREGQSYEKSYEYHLRSAQKDIYSAGQVAFMQTIGSGCEFNYIEIEKYYLSIIDLLDNPRKATLCRFYLEHGEFIKAAKIYTSIADVYPDAGYQLGLMYKRGVLNDPFMPDYHMAEKYFRMALDLGCLTAAFELGTLYFNPTGDFKKDFHKAQNYYLIAAENGHCEAQYMLGFMYLHGHVVKDRKKAVKFFELAANQGHILSSAHLGTLYLESDFLDYDKAFKYASYAANCGDDPSKFVLGTMYLFGRGCDPDEDKAYFLLKEAAESGAPEASILLRQLENGEFRL